MKNARNKKTGILALLGLAGGALAYWKYKNLTPEEKANMKAKIKNTGDKLKEGVSDVENTISEKYEQLKTSVQK